MKSSLQRQVHKSAKCLSLVANLFKNVSNLKRLVKAYLKFLKDQIFSLKIIFFFYFV